jgi:hypothetical protein
VCLPLGAICIWLAYHAFGARLLVISIHWRRFRIFVGWRYSGHREYCFLSHCSYTKERSIICISLHLPWQTSKKDSQFSASGGWKILQRLRGKYHPPLTLCYMAWNQTWLVFMLSGNINYVHCSDKQFHCIAPLINCQLFLFLFSALIALLLAMVWITPSCTGTCLM